MGSQPVDSQILSASFNLNAPLSEVRAILTLLALAHISLQAHTIKDDCQRTLRACMSRIQARYGLTTGQFDEPQRGNEATFDGVLRILDYVKLEIQHKLNDLQTATEVNSCLDRLAIRCVSVH